MRKRNILIIIMAYLLVLIIALFFIFNINPKPPPPVNVTPSVEFTIVDSGVLDYGTPKLNAYGSPESGHQNIIYILSQLNGKGIRDTTVDVKLFQDEVPKDIYLLDYSSSSSPGCTECEGLGDFRKSLERDLKDYGLIDENSTLNQIKIYQLDRLARRSIIIVPTGKIPSQLVGLESGADLGRLMDRGFVIVFIGSELDEALNSNGSVSPIPPSQFNQYNISYQKRFDLLACPDVYKFKNPAFSVSSNIYCAISFTKSNDGYFVVFPRSIDIGWGYNGNDAAADVSRAIYNVVWQQPLTVGSLRIPASNTHETNSTPSMIYLQPSPYQTGWANVYLKTNSSNNTRIYYNLFSKRVTNTINGDMYHRSKAVSGDRDLIIDFKLNEDFTRPKEANLSVYAYKDNKFVRKEFVQTINIQKEYTRSTIFTVDFEPGNYTLRAEDDDHYIYAQSFLSVPPVNVNLDLAIWDMENPLFFFSATLPQDPISSAPDRPTEPVTGRVVLINLNNSPTTDLLSTPFLTTTDSKGGFNYTSPTMLPFGNYTFKINVSGNMVHLDTYRKKPLNWLDNPFNIGIIILIAVVGVFAVALRMPEKPIYVIDVPDFPPLEKVVVPVSRFSFLSLFDSVNKEYKWSFMPLSAQELKNEMRRKITYKGVPILITDYNLDKILDELTGTGDVTKAINFYGLRDWESKSGRSMRYLAIFRLLRNFFINNAIPFTELNTRKDCDMMVSAKGEPIYIHIYTDEDTFKRALGLIGTGKNFVVFETKTELEGILKRLDLSYSQLALILKSEIDTGNIQLVHSGNFGEMLGR